MGMKMGKSGQNINIQLHYDQDGPKILDRSCVYDSQNHTSKQTESSKNLGLNSQLICNPPYFQIRNSTQFITEISLQAVSFFKAKSVDP